MQHSRGVELMLTGNKGLRERVKQLKLRKQGNGS